METEFKQMAEQAAQLERDGEKKAAAVAWRKSCQYSGNEANREWCNARAGFCESRFARETAQ